MAKSGKKSKGHAPDHSSSAHPHGRFGETSLPLHLAYAIPDHPWIDSADGAAVRIAMTVAAPGQGEGILEKVTAERPMQHGEVEVSLDSATGKLAANLQIGADLGSAAALASNEKVAGMGVALHGAGFILLPEEANKFRASGSQVIKAYVGGIDLLQNPRERYLVDFSFMTEQAALAANPAAYQHVYNHVKPERDQNRRATLKDNWWKFAWERPVLRKALSAIPRYIGTTETSKHRVFQFIPTSTLADHKIICIAFDDAYFLAVLSSKIHIIWSLALGGRLEDRPVYNKTTCFDPFPFPALEEGALKQRIRDLGERLDAHRKRQQEAHPGLTLTGLYNVLEKLRSGEALTAKDKQIHDQGLVTLLKQIHDELDEAVLEAYGWSDLKTQDGKTQDTREEEMLTRLVALNHARAAEEKRGQIRWLRPEYQNRSGDPRSPEQTQLPGTDVSPQSKIQNQQSSIINPSSNWPERLPAQVTLIRHLLTQTPTATPAELSNHFGRKNQKRTDQIEGIIETLKGLGQI
jgi:hypothetical protein